MAGILRTAVFGVVLLAAGLPQAKADGGTVDDDVVRAGARVRVTRAGSKFTGILRDLDDQNITVETRDSRDPVVMRRADVWRLEVYRGSRSRAGHGAVVGFVALGALAIPAWQGCGECEGMPPARFVIGAGAVGAAIGATIGALIRSDPWQNVPVARVQLGVTPTLGRGRTAGLTLSLGFR